MANNTTQERLQSLFNQASGGSGSSDSLANASVFDPSSEGSVGESYHGDSASRGSSSTQSSGGGSGIASLAEGIFGGALGLIPLIGGIASLFGGGSEQQQPAFERYQMPSSISFEAADTGSGLAAADYGQMGLPRLYSDAETSASSAASSAPAVNPAPSVGSTGASPSAASTTAASGSSTPQISVNVQAMDAQSFMSYSGEIAKAVRDAMLNLSSINDVVAEL